MDKRNDYSQTTTTMTHFQKHKGFAPVAQVEAYWEALRGTRLMPKRSDIDPRGIEQALEYTFIVERIAPGIARLRIAGSHLSTLMGMEVRGMPLTALISPNYRRQLSDTLEEVFETPAMCELHLKAPADRTTRGALDARLLLLPLKSDLGDVSRILGCLVSQGDIGQAPRRFDIERSDLRAITTSAKTVERPMVPPAAKPHMPPVSNAMQEAPAPFKPEQNSKFPPYLRLVKTEE